MIIVAELQSHSDLYSIAPFQQRMRKKNKNSDREDVSCCKMAAKQRLKPFLFEGLGFYFYDHYLQKVILRRDAKYETVAFVRERDNGLEFQLLLTNHSSQYRNNKVKICQVFTGFQI